MFARLQITIVLALALSVSTGAVPVADTNGWVCSNTLEMWGATYYLTLSRDEWYNGQTILQCNWDNPPIQGYSPTCVYDASGSLIYTNTEGCPYPIPG
ncbi:hypothetical protein DFH06DRAFT_1172640 [Mycena polygramma]|nr:hypothetical protein DFH06DRAFT_1192166 [Mycena polygramma]KAJ7983194.1 hypothetical protein DFH06DRAFT_1172640 [Mycena polygramma]